jgi:hypothetical protein
MELDKKLKINSSLPLYVLNCPDDVRIPAADFQDKLPGNAIVQQLIVFVTDSISLQHNLKKVNAHIAPETLFWICYPKKSGAIQSDLIMSSTWEIVFNTGYRCQTSISLDDNWTGMRFTNAPKKKPTLADTPMEARVVPGIDFINRTAELPADARKHMGQFSGMIAFFDKLSFSHKREYITSIEDAKKPETRMRRIEKTAEMLQKMMAEKKPTRQNHK